MFIYTFWEPRDSMPGYLQLCIETWKKFLPNATIIVLDYKNIGEFLDVREIGLNLFSGRFSRAQIVDAIRIALLAKRGGVWLDADTIILSPEAEKYFLPDEKHRTVFFGYPERNSVHIAFINTPPLNTLMNFWNNEVREKIWRLNSATPVDWDFIGNSFIDKYIEKHLDEVVILDANSVVPERELVSPEMPADMAYIHYYFLQNKHLSEINTKMLLLHNSWTPIEYKMFSLEEFLRCDCTMTNILTEILGIKLPPQSERLRVREIMKK